MTGDMSDPWEGRHLVYLAGAPAAGKSTLMATLTHALTRTPSLQPFPHDLLCPAPGTHICKCVCARLPDAPQGPCVCEAGAGPIAVELGRRRDRFAGTDALALNISPKVTAWLRHTEHNLILGEGDRLAHLGFLAAAELSGFTPHLIVLRAPRDVLDARAVARGSAGQNVTWRAGRATKVERLAGQAEHVGFHVVHLDGTDPPEVNALYSVAKVAPLARLGTIR